MVVYNFVRPKTVNYKKGVLIIDSDDGIIGDYTHWFPLCMRLGREYSTWANSRPAVFCPAIVTNHVGGGPNVMSVEQIQELARQGFEPQSHGRDHISVGALPVLENVTSGATTVQVQAAGTIRRNLGAYDFRIFEGETEEILDIAKVEGRTSRPGIITLGSPLQNSYTTEARVQLTDDSARDVLQGSLDDLQSWGVEARHFVYPYHSGGIRHIGGNTSQWMEDYFDSGRGRTSSTGINTKGDIDWNNLTSLLNTEPATKNTIDNSLDEISKTDGLLIFYGHGEQDADNLSLLENLIRGALDRGIRILTKSQACEYYSQSDSR